MEFYHPACCCAYGSFAAGNCSIVHAGGICRACSLASSFFNNIKEKKHKRQKSRKTKQNDFYLARNRTIGTVKNIDVVNRAVEIVERNTERCLVLFMDNKVCDKALRTFCRQPAARIPYTFSYEGCVLKQFTKTKEEQRK